MGFPEHKTADKIKQIFHKYPGGTTISEISSKLKMNRNLVAKYLEHLRVAGQLEMKTVGSARIYSVSSRVPVSSLMDYSSDLVLLLDREQHVIRINDRLLAATGADREAIAGKCIRDSDNQLLQGLWKILKGRSRSISTGEGEFTSVIRGEQRNFRYRLVPVVFEDGSPGTALILQDVTADTQYREIRETSRNSRDGVYADQTELIVHLTPDGLLTDVNEAFCRFFLWKKADCIGHNFRYFISIDDHTVLTNAIQSLKPGVPVANISCRMIRPSGQMRYVEGTLRAIFDEKGTVHEYLAIWRDISDKHEALLKIDQMISRQARFYLTAFRLSDVPPDANIYDAIGMGFRELLPSAIIAINTLDAATLEVTTWAFLGEQERKVFSRYIGRDVVGFTIAYSDPVDEYHVIRNILGGKLIKVPGDLNVMLLGQVPRDTCRRIGEELNLGDMYVIGFVSQNVIIGNAAIMLRKGDDMDQQENIEIFARQATLALKCRLLEEGKNIPVPLSENPTSNGTPSGFPYSCPDNQAPSL